MLRLMCLFDSKLSICHGHLHESHPLSGRLHYCIHHQNRRYYWNEK